MKKILGLVLATAMLVGSISVCAAQTVLFEDDFQSSDYAAGVAPTSTNGVWFTTDNGQSKLGYYTKAINTANETQAISAGTGDKLNIMFDTPMETNIYEIDYDLYINGVADGMVYALFGETQSAKNMQNTLVFNSSTRKFSLGSVVLKDSSENEATVANVYGNDSIGSSSASNTKLITKTIVDFTTASPTITVTLTSPSGTDYSAASTLNYSKVAKIHFDYGNRIYLDNVKISCQTGTDEPEEEIDPSVMYSEDFNDYNGGQPETKNGVTWNSVNWSNVINNPIDDNNRMSYNSNGNSWITFENELSSNEYVFEFDLYMANADSPNLFSVNISSEEMTAPSQGKMSFLFPENSTKFCYNNSQSFVALKDRDNNEATAENVYAGVAEGTAKKTVKNHVKMTFDFKNNIIGYSLTANNGVEYLGESALEYTKIKSISLKALDRIYIDNICVTKLFDVTASFGGEPILSELSAGDTVTLKYDAVNITGERQSFVLIGAIYNGKKLSDVKLISVNMGQEETTKTDSLILNITDATDLSIKGMIWSDLSDDSPLINAINIK